MQLERHGEPKKSTGISSLAHRGGRTRSLEISPPLGRKSLTLYPIELGGPIIPASTKQLVVWFAAMGQY